jgi:hypothetical protein
LYCGWIFALTSPTSFTMPMVSASVFAVSLLIVAMFSAVRRQA